VVALIAVGVLALGALTLRELGLGDEDSPDATIEPPSIHLGVLGLAAERPLEELGESGNACQRLAALAATLGGREQAPRGFLRALGLAAAGIRPPPRALADLARGGDDLIPGGGFRGPYADGTAGQVRHFAGVAVATTYGGGAATRLISVFPRRDPVRSADGRLSERALDFAAMIGSGELPVAQSRAWILENLCRPTGLTDRLAE